MKPLVRAANPQTLYAAIEQARFHEEHMIALKLPPDKTSKNTLAHFTNSPKALLPNPTFTSKGPQNFPPKTPQNTNNQNRTPTSPVQRPPRFMPAAERAEKMAKGLCFFCDQPYERGHRCPNKGKQLFLIKVIGEEEKEDLEVAEPFDRELEFVTEGVSPQISINAMCGSSGFHAMRVNGHLRKKTLHILIDSRSTHNFLDEQIG